MKNKQFSVKVSAIALAVLLASCGGGGYYDDNTNTSGNSGTENGNQNGTDTNESVDLPTNINSFTALSSSKSALLLEGDTSVLTVQLLQTATGGSLENKEVLLQIVDAQKYGASFEPSKQTTDENGYATFTIKLNTVGLGEENKNLLLQNGLQINVLNSSSQKIGSHTLSVVENESKKPLYDLIVTSNKNQLSLKGDNAAITIRALDNNAGSLTGKKVSLAVLDYMTNKVTIEGLSEAITDQYGDAVFNIKLPATTGSAAANLKAQGVKLEATITDTNGVKVVKPLELKVIDGATVNPIGNITFGNAGVLTSNSDKTYYTENFSAQVVDIDGQPLKEQKVTMKIDIISGTVGRFILKEEIEQLRNADLLNMDIKQLKPLQNALADQQLLLQELNNQLTMTEDEQDKKRIQIQINTANLEISRLNNEVAALEAKKELIGRFEILPRTYLICGAAVDASNDSLATSLVDQNNQVVANEYTYTTDRAGKFDFKVNYLRRYAGWQTVQIKASSTVSGKSIESSMIYPLSTLKADLQSTSSEPFDNSPYSTGSCQYQKPWAGLL